MKRQMFLIFLHVRNDASSIVVGGLQAIFGPSVHDRATRMLFRHETEAFPIVIIIMKDRHVMIKTKTMSNAKWKMQMQKVTRTKTKVTNTFSIVFIVINRYVMIHTKTTLKTKTTPTKIAKIRTWSHTRNAFQTWDHTTKFSTFIISLMFCHRVKHFRPGMLG